MKTNRINSKTELAKPTSKDKGSSSYPTTVDTFNATNLNVGGSKSFRRNPDTGVLEYSNDNGSLWSAVGSGGGGGSTATSDLEAAELGLPTVSKQNQILDTFNTDLGTKSNMVASGSALRLTSTSGSYLRAKLTSAKMTKVSGEVVADIQMLKPQAALIASPYTTIKFDGDVTSFFVDTKNIMIASVVDSDGVKVLRHVLNSLDKPAKFPVSGTPSYSSVNDETTLTITNSEAININNGLSTGADVATYLRFMPFDLKISAASDDAATYEEIDLDEAIAYDDGVVGLPGEGYFSESRGTGITGTALKTDIVPSPNGQYILKRTQENRGSNDYWVYEYSVDRGKNWNYFGGSKSSSEVARNSDMVNEGGSSFYAYNRGQLKVANNGKFFTTYYYFGGTYDQVNGLYGDMTITTPALNQVPDRGWGAGVVRSSGATHCYSHIAIDETDCSFISVAVHFSNHSIDVLTYNNYGASALGDSNTITQTFNYMSAIGVSGSGSSHKAYLAARSNADGYLYYYYLTEASPNTLVLIGNNANNCHIEDFKITSTRFITVWTPLSSNAGLYYDYVTLSTDTLTSAKVIAPSTVESAVDLFNGWSQSDPKTAFKNIGQKIVVDPSDADHVFFVKEVYAGVAGEFIRYPVLFEVQDITTDAGQVLTQTSVNNFLVLSSSSTYTEIGQTFVAPANQVESIILRGFKTGLVHGKKMWMEIYETSGGLPTTQVSGAISNEIDLTYASANTNGELYYFRFPTSVSLTPSTTYAFILKTDMSIDASNYMNFNSSTANPYANGTAVAYNGSAWSTIGHDLNFWMLNHGAINIGNAYGITAGYIYANLYNGESSIVLRDNQTIRFITRRYGAMTAQSHPITGHPYTRLININSGSEATMTDLVPLGFSADFDEGLVLNVSLGHPDAFDKDLLTGAYSGEAVNDRSGTSRSRGYSGVTRVADSNFESGYAIDFAATGYAYLGDTATAGNWNGCLGLRDFALEAEIAYTTEGFIVTAQNNTVSDYIRLGISGGYLYWTSTVSSVQYTTAANDKTEPTAYHKVRATRKNGVVKLWRNEGSGWVEVGSYSSNNANNRDFSLSSNGVPYFSANSNAPTASSYAGKIGYVKWKIVPKNTLNESSPFTYEGWRDQAAIVSLQNCGHLVFGEKITGRSNYTIAENYDILQQSDGQESAIVDSYRQTLKYKNNAFTNQGRNCKLKLEMGRGTTEDQSNIQGLVFDYQK